LNGKVNSNLYTYYFDRFFLSQQYSKQTWLSGETVEFIDIEASIECHFEEMEKDNKTLSGDDFIMNDTLLKNYKKWWDNNKMLIQKLQEEN